MLDPLCKGGRPKIPSILISSFEYIDPELIDPATKNPITQHTFRKVSATPTIFRGNVYFPIYEPPGGGDACGIGNAFICVTDDECGTNNSHLLQKGARPEGTKCNLSLIHISEPTRPY